MSWLSKTLVSCWPSDWPGSCPVGKRGGRKGGFICCSRSATAQLIVRQRGVATELTSAIPGAIGSSTSVTESSFSAYLPVGDNLRTTISSPQFSQALSMFWSALQSGQAGPVVRQFGLGNEAVTAAATGNLEEFVTALESEAKTGATATSTTAGSQDDKSKKPPANQGGGNSADKKKDDDDDEGMALD